MSLLRRPVWHPSRRLTVDRRSRPTRLGPGKRRGIVIEEVKESAPAHDQKSEVIERGEKGKVTKTGGVIALGVNALGCIGRLQIRPPLCTVNHQAAFGISLIE